MEYQLNTKKFDLKSWRLTNFISQRELGRICGIDYSYLCRLETGKHIASLEMAKKIFKKLEKWEAKTKPQVGTNFPTLIEELEV